MAVISNIEPQGNFYRIEEVKKRVVYSFEGVVDETESDEKSYIVSVFKAIEKMWQDLPRGEEFFQSKHISLLDSLVLDVTEQYVAQLKSEESCCNKGQRAYVGQEISGIFPCFELDGIDYLPLSEPDAALLVSSVKGYLAVLKSLLKRHEDGTYRICQSIAIESQVRARQKGKQTIADELSKKVPVSFSGPAQQRIRESLRLCSISGTLYGSPGIFYRNYSMRRITHDPCSLSPAKH